jgi:hypothetical protein
MLFVKQVIANGKDPTSAVAAEPKGAPAGPKGGKTAGRPPSSLGDSGRQVPLTIPGLEIPAPAPAAPDPYRPIRFDLDAGPARQPPEAPEQPPAPPPAPPPSPPAYPPPVLTPADQLEEWEELEDDRPRRRRRPREWDDYDDRPRRRYGCRYCGCDWPPQTRKRFGGASMALLCIGIIFRPLIIVAFFVQDEWRECADCGARL